MKVLYGKVEVRIIKSGKPEDMLSELADADGMILRIGSIDRETIMAAKRLRVIGRPGVGLDKIDVAAATERGIPFVIAPGANTRSVAEHALAMMFAAAKDIVNSDQQTRNGNFNVRESYKSFELSGKTVGIIGFGNTGREMAKLAFAVGMKVAVFSPSASHEIIAGFGYYPQRELEQLLRNADVVSIHVPLTDKTRLLIGERELNMMKPGAILVNIARGEIIDELALEKALKNKKIHSAAVDVLTAEPVNPDHPLLKLDNFIITPHIAGLTRESAAAAAVLAAEGVLAVLNGEKWPHVANIRVYDHPVWKNRSCPEMTDTPKD
jgi:D-3-phosphoglycerate dehydrogenase